MGYSYFPGCTLHQQEQAFDRSARAVAERLGLDMVEPDNWQCCGAVYPLSSDALFPLISPYRTLATANMAGYDTVTLCSGCFNVLRRTAHRVNTDEEVRAKLAAFTELEPTRPLRAVHYLEAVREIDPDRIKQALQPGLEGLRVACYYGCLLVRPPDEMEFDDCERPTIMDDLLTAAGASVVDFSHHSECCGAYLSVAPGLTRPAATSAAARVLAAASDADVIAVSCPLCRYNLRVAAEAEEQKTGGKPPAIEYFTELLARAFGIAPGLPDGVMAG